MIRGSDLPQMATDWPLCLIFGYDIFQQSDSTIPSSSISKNIYIKRPFPSLTFWSPRGTDHSEKLNASSFIFGRSFHSNAGSLEPPKVNGPFSSVQLLSCV